MKVCQLKPNFFFALVRFFFFFLISVLILLTSLDKHFIFKVLCVFCSGFVILLFRYLHCYQSLKGGHTLRNTKLQTGSLEYHQWDRKQTFSSWEKHTSLTLFLLKLTHKWNNWELLVSKDLKKQTLSSRVLLWVDLCVLRLLYVYLARLSGQICLQKFCKFNKTSRDKTDKTNIYIYIYIYIY